MNFDLLSERGTRGQRDAEQQAGEGNQLLFDSSSAHKILLGKLLAHRILTFMRQA
jgi:hypothetical protein